MAMEIENEDGIEELRRQMYEENPLDFRVILNPSTQESDKNFGHRYDQARQQIVSLLTYIPRGIDTPHMDITEIVSNAIQPTNIEGSVLDITQFSGTRDLYWIAEKIRQRHLGILVWIPGQKR